MEASMLGNVRINAEAAACQIIDGEAVLIHFDSGRYFSSLGSGSEIIRLLELGHTVEQITAAFRRHYGDATEHIDDAIRSFVEELLLENLFLPSEHGGGTSAELVLDVGAEFEPPKLEKYSELEDLLKLDPIHDVDPAGWPLREVQQSE
jgi:hypothetical protein